MKKSIVRLFFASVLFISVFFVLTACNNTPKAKDEFKELIAKGEANITVDKDYTVKSDAVISKNITVTINSGATLTVNKGVKLNVEKGASLTVKGSLIYENESDSNIEGNVYIRSGGTYTDKNSDADWVWSHATFTGSIFVDNGGLLYLDDELFVGSASTENAKISILSGNYAGETDILTQRLHITPENIYIDNGIFSINEKIAETRTWNLGADTYLYINKTNKIKFNGPSSDKKARIYCVGKAKNNETTCKLDADTGYTWVTDNNKKQWTQVAPLARNGQLNQAAFLGFGAEAKMNLNAYKAADEYTFVWNGKAEGAYTDEPGTDGTRYSNLKYAERSGVKNDYNLYVPSGYKAGDDIPLVLFIHGGSWTTGNKEVMDAECVRFAKKGYLAATINTRLAGETGADNGAILEMIEDVHDCVAALKTKIEELGYKCSGMAVSGNSSGGNVAMLYGYQYGSNAPIPVKLLLPTCGPSDFHADSWQYSTGVTNPMNLPNPATGNPYTDDELLNLGAGMAAAIVASSMHYTDQTQIANLMTKLLEGAKNGKCDEETEKILAKVSPAAHVATYKIPTVGFYGGMDTTVSPQNFNRLKTALENNGVDHKLIFSPLCTHSLIEDESAAKAFYETAYEYIEKYLRVK